MANLCSNHMYITGPAEVIQDLARKIRDKDPNLLGLFPWFELTDNDYGLWKDTFIPEEKSINLSFGSKWYFPTGPFDCLVTKYPRLTFVVNSEEPGMEIFQKITASEGMAHTENLSPIDYYTETNEDFASERRTLKEIDYEKFKDYLLNDWTSDKYFIYEYLEKEIVARIKDKDLPLFIGKEWLNSYTEELISQRLKKE